jgi:SAM-dependent methyltransferase
MTVVSYELDPPREVFRRRVEELVVSFCPRTVFDLGGGANPVLSPEFIARHGLRYVVADASAEQLALAPDSYEKAVLDMSAPEAAAPAACDLAISRYVLEHVADPEVFHRNVARLLTDGGRAAHFFSTLYALPFTLNRLLPGAVGRRLAGLSIPVRETDGREEVFPAAYRWCRGPSRSQLRRFEGLGFEIEEYVGYFGHIYYKRVPALQALEDRLARSLVRHPVPALTSFARVVLVKPG